MRVTQGFLPFGSADPSVVLQITLTETVLAANVPYGTVEVVGPGTAPTHDSTLGMKSTDGSDDCSYKLTVPDAVLDDLDDAGQLTIQVEGKFLWDNNITDSTGDVYSGHQTLISMTALAGVSKTAYALFQKRTGGQLRCQVASGGTVDLSYHEFQESGQSQGGDVKLHSEGKPPDFVTVNVGWWGGFTGSGAAILAIDGHVMSYGVPSDATAAGIFDALFIGSDHTAAGEFANSRFFRNLQISTARPEFQLSEELGSIVYLSDSLLDNTNITVTSNNSSDNTSQFQCQKRLTKRGRHGGDYLVDENGGWGIGSYITNQQLIDRLPTVLAANPTALVISAGTNDFVNAGYLGSTFTSDYRDLLEQAFFGATKDERTTINHILISRMPPRYASSGNPINDNPTFVANQADVLDRVAALIAWWDTTHPTWAGRIRILDLWGALGADNNLARNSNFPTHTIDDTHMASNWNRLTGELIADDLLAMAHNGGLSNRGTVIGTVL